MSVTWSTPGRPGAPEHQVAPGLECVAWKPLHPRRSTLVGFATLRLPRAGLALEGCPVHERDGSTWCHPPAKELRDASGARTGWRDIVIFDSAGAKRAWSSAAAEAVARYRAEHPEADAVPEAGGAFEW